MKARWAALFPNKACLLCRQSSTTLLCDYCYQDLSLFDLHKCNHNLMNLPSVQSGLSGKAFDTLVSVSDYQPPLSNLIRGLKYASRFIHAKALAELFIGNALDAYALSSLPQVILPVPLHSQRFNMRKFNQAVELANHISVQTRIPLDCTWLKRLKPTSNQAGLNALQRRKNMHLAFALNKTRDYQHVAVLDDVVTTGETTYAIHQLLKSYNPAIRVDIWSMCLTLSPQQRQT